MAIITGHNPTLAHVVYRTSHHLLVFDERNPTPRQKSAEENMTLDTFFDGIKQKFLPRKVGLWNPKSGWSFLGAYHAVEKKRQSVSRRQKQDQIQKWANQPTEGEWF